jgi:purine-nucleoside phosphorylase
VLSAHREITFILSSLHAGSKELTEAFRYLNAKHIQPEIGIVLGTGLGDEFVNRVRNPLIIPYNSIPFFPVSTVSGHRGQFVFGKVSRKNVLVMQGRIHYYEGYDMQKVTFPIRIMKLLGVKSLLISNAAGNLNPSWKHGELMLIDDHINTIPVSPLRGLGRVENGNLFLDQSKPYSGKMNKILKSVAREYKIRLRKGVYVSNMGPALETKAEYKYLRMIGGDAVGMSTVPEVIMANYLGMQCAAISVLTNDASEAGTKPLQLEDVIEVASKSSRKLAELFIGLIKEL